MKHVYTLLPALVAFALGCGSSSTTASDSLASIKGPTDTGAPSTNVPASTTSVVKGLLGPVDVLRDKNGMVHIYATTATDAFRVEAYQMARDRTVQAELVRRTAEGSLAEILGTPDLIDQDIFIRAIGLKRVAQQMYDAMPKNSRTKKWLDAYADGITQFNANLQSGVEKLPAAMVGLPLAAFGPWTGVDVLAVARLEAFDLSYTGDDEVAKTRFVAAAKSAFNSNATSADAQKRAGFLVDTFRFAPLDPTPVLPGFPTDAIATPKTGAKIFIHRSDALRSGKNTVPKAKQLWETAVARVRGMFGSLGATGSNNWVLDPKLSATGHAMLANDPHLALSAPPVFWAVHVNVTSTDANENLDFAGMSFPGIPGVILGFNEHLAWGATTANYDVSDVYEETLTADGASVMFKGAPVALQTVHETINVAGAQPIQYDVKIVPQHGVILPNIDPTTHQILAPSGSAISSRWTGQVPTNDIEAIVGLLG
ncbi:MAG: penicillin acylase family protein, partial [Polyangiaceae bacterium]